MKTSLSKLFLLVFVLGSLSSCVKDQSDVKLLYYSAEDYAELSKTLDLPSEPYDYTPFTPAHFGPVSFNAVSNSKATLGRVLFYDKKLSANNSVSCASCHDQLKAFADPVAFSKGFEGKATLRNSFALGAVASFTSTYGDEGSSRAQSSLFWDNRASSIAEQSRQTIQDEIEMGMDLKELANKLNQEPYYKILFQKAYYTDNINEDMVLDALTNFINGMATSQTKFDEGMKNNHNPQVWFNNFTEQENRGKDLYINNCGSCHGNIMVQTQKSFANNGLAMVYEDKGIGALTGESDMNGVFKVPLLRNIELTGPYMHDGSIETLEDVIEHYNSGIQNHRNLDDELKRDMNFSDQDKTDLVAFLKTLTDEEFIRDVRFSDPFKQ